MKCPKCGYLGFDRGDRCRNCGYDFSLSAFSHTSLSAGGKADPLDLTLDEDAAEIVRPPLDLDRMIGAPEPAAAADLPLFAPSGELHDHDRVRRGPEPASVRVMQRDVDDAPMIATPARPRAPLGVRRATPEIPRARSPKPSPHNEPLFDTPIGAANRAFESTPTVQVTGEPLAGPISRIAAALIDASLLVALDAAVLYFTVRLTGAEVFQLPILPLAAFILLLNGGYFIAFTAVGGQSIGKMALGIKVIAQDEPSVPIGRATVRTLAYILSALPLGAGFLPGVFGADRLTLHDRLAHTRVVRPSST